MYLKSLLTSVVIKPTIPYKIKAKKKKKRRKKTMNGIAITRNIIGPGSEPPLMAVNIKILMKTIKKDKIYKIIPVIKIIMPVA